MATSILPLRKPVMLAVGILVALTLAPRWLTINRTASSAPRGLYLRVHRPLRRGELVEVCLPHEVAVFAASRAYIRSAGRCADNSEPIVKDIGGMPGDEVYVAPATIMAADSARRPMPQSFPGWHHVPVGEVWLQGDARKS